MKDPEPKPAGTWDFKGACAPTHIRGGKYSGGIGETFSLGCFQWVPMARGAGTKPGKVSYRVKGMRHDPAPAFNAAAEYCARKNAEREESE